MLDSADPHEDSFEDLIPEGADRLESIVCTEELQRRPRRPPDFEQENRGLVALAFSLLSIQAVGIG